MEIGFSQRDPRWAEQILGTSRYTLGEAGCLVTAAAAMVASTGIETDPGRLNEWIRQSFGYVDDCLFVFSSIDGLGWQNTGFIECADVLAPMAQLTSAIGAGAGCLAMVDWRPGGPVQPHWVWVLELTERRGRIMDPWQEPGREFVELATYLAEDWTPARGIFAAALYSRTDQERRSIRRRLSLQHQAYVSLRAAPNGRGDSGQAR